MAQLAPRAGAASVTIIDINADRLGTAVRYARRGWPVFPCKPGSKVPATKHWFRDATTDLAQIERLWGCWPNIAIPTGGDGPDVLDVDVARGRRGCQSLHTAIRAGLVSASARLGGYSLRRDAPLLPRRCAAERQPAYCGGLPRQRATRGRRTATSRRLVGQPVTLSHGQPDHCSPHSNVATAARDMACQSSCTPRPGSSGVRARPSGSRVTGFSAPKFHGSAG